MVLRILFILAATVALIVPLFPSMNHSQISLAATPVPSASPYPCYPISQLINVGDHLDMTGATDSTVALQDAVNNLISTVASGATPPASQTTANYGGCMSIPPGILSISRDITFTCASTGGGPCAGIYGAGTQNTTILETTPSSIVFDACPTAGSALTGKYGSATSPGYTPNMYLPSPCPAATATLTQNGLVFADLTVAYSMPATTVSCANQSPSWCGMAASVWSFPTINGLLIKNVAVVNANNCIDAGYASYVKIEGPGTGNGPGATTEFSCSGDFMAFHGGTATVIVDGVSWKGGRGPGSGSSPVSQGVFMDFTDLNASRYLASANTTIMTVTHSDLEGAAWGFLNFADANTIISDTTISDTLCDGFTFACYAFYTVPGYTKNGGGSQHLSIDDTRWMTSWANAVYLDGGFYAGATGGANLSIGGNNLLAGSNSRDNGSAVTYLANRNLSMQWAGTPTNTPQPTPWPTLATGGFSADGSAVQVVLNPASGSGVGSFPCAVVTAAANDNVRSIVSRIPQSCNSNQAGNATPSATSPPYQVTYTYTANPYYGFLEFIEWGNALAGVAPGPLNNGTPTLAENTDSYSIYTSGNIEPGPIPSPWLQAGTAPCAATPTALASDLASIGYTGNVYCQVGYLSYGAAVKLTNAQRGVRVHSVTMTSDKGACVWIEPGTGRQMDVGSTYMGTGCAFPMVFPSPSSTPPVDYSIIANDMSNPGVGEFTPPQPFTNLPSAALSMAKPGNGSNNLTGQISSNRGISLINGGGSAYFNSFPVATVTISTSAQTWYNLSPFYCVVNATNNGPASVSSTLFSGNAVSSPAFVPTFTLPPQGSFSFVWSGTDSVSVVETCTG